MFVLSWFLLCTRGAWSEGRSLAGVLLQNKRTLFLKMHLFYTRVRRNSVFFLCCSHGVLPKAAGCRVGIVDSWVLSEVGKLQWEDAQWITIDTRRKREQGMVAGKFHGCIQRLALVVDSFLGNPLLTSLPGLRVIPGTPRAGFQLKLGLPCIQAWYLGVALKIGPSCILILFLHMVSPWPLKHSSKLGSDWAVK